MNVQYFKLIWEFSNQDVMNKYHLGILRHSVNGM